MTLSPRVLAALAVLALGACDRGAPRERSRPAASSSPAAGSAAAAPAAGSGSPAACTLPELPLRRPAGKRVVAIGDLHGDLSAARAALRTAGAIDDADRWIGGDLVVVQTGDVLDRGDDEQVILDLVFRLERDAAAAGGALVFLLGNHELMNGAGDFRYVTATGAADFDDVPGLDVARWAAVPRRYQRRIAALGPGGPYARRLAQHNIVAIVGDTVFSHAGVLGDWVDRVDLANRASRCWLDGQAGSIDDPPPALASDASPVWTRAAGIDPVDCAQVTAALTALGARRMVVGHTVQQTGITSACDGALWRIDVGLGKAYGGPIEVLELSTGAAPKVLRGTRL